MLCEIKLQEDDAAFPFPGESIDVCKYLHTLPRRDFAGPETRLMLVVLEDALKCLEKYVRARDRRGKALFHETEDWVFSTDEDWVFSFTSVCEVLGLHPQYIRKAVLQWKTRQLKTGGAGAKAKISYLGA